MHLASSYDVPSCSLCATSNGCECRVSPKELQARTIPPFPHLPMTAGTARVPMTTRTLRSAGLRYVRGTSGGGGGNAGGVPGGGLEGVAALGAVPPLYQRWVILDGPIDDNMATGLSVI